ncbi:MAG TPA: PH domain-containing protein [Nitrososphaeraceae archaeon]|nr:PH domain-containing protein [Nitrososphaeraceae archaeon]
MPSGTDRRNEDGSASSFITDITDKNELEEIQRIANRLVKDEKVIFVAKQSRFKPGGSKGSPDTLFVTTQRLIVRNPSMMGIRENFSSVNYDRISSLNVKKGFFSSTLKIMAEGFAGDIDAVDKEKAEKIMSYIEEKMNQATTSAVQSRTDTTTITSNPQSSSAADELTKLARLKEQGILSEAEFNQMKQEILKKF